MKCSMPDTKVIKLFCGHLANILWKGCFDKLHVHELNLQKYIHWYGTSSLANLRWEKRTGHLASKDWCDIVIFSADNFLF